MQEQIKRIVRNEKSFTFNRNDVGLWPARYLNSITQEVPNEEGMYWVFSSKIINPNADHLHFELKNQMVELVYFGKAGGENIKQGLQGRIRNVVSDANRQIKDMQRGTYWALVMQPEDLDIESLFVFYQTMKQAKETEDSFYRFLDHSNKKYPELVKPRGRARRR